MKNILYKIKIGSLIAIAFCISCVAFYIAFLEMLRLYDSYIAELFK